MPDTWHIVSQDAETQSEVLPGNPGVVDFYLPFAAELHRRLGLGVTVAAHPGHGPDLPAEASGVERAVAHHLQVLLS